MVVQGGFADAFEGSRRPARSSLKSGMPNIRLAQSMTWGAGISCSASVPMKAAVHTMSVSLGLKRIREKVCDGHRLPGRLDELKLKV